MPRETFHQELDELVEDVLGLGTELEDSLESMGRAMESRVTSLSPRRNSG
jgi:hypothetical protein